MMPGKINEDLLKFHAFVEKEAVALRFGTITFNVVIKDGIPLLHTLNLVKNKRRKYNVNKQTPASNLRLNQNYFGGQSLSFTRVRRG